MNKTNEDKELERISINIVRSESNIENIEFSYIKNGINIIVGENNVGKTNLLNWVFENFDELIKKDIDPLLMTKKREEYEENFLYLLYYLDIETSFYSSLFDKNNPKKIKKFIGKLTWKYNIYGENFEVNSDLDKQELGWKEWIEEVARTNKFGSSSGIVIEEKKETGDTKNFEVKAINKSRLHSVRNTGSGNWKFWVLTNFLHSIGYQFSQSTLLIDEPELLLHPYHIREAANLIREELRWGSLSVILTTHSPEFLSYFIHENKKTNVIIVQKNNETGLLKQPLYFWEVIEQIEKKVSEKYEKYAWKSEKNEEGVFSHLSYINKWKVLLNEKTLKILFSRKVLFVEGIIECILFRNILNEKLKEELEGSEIEIVPIFGKFHYIFFATLAEKLKFKYWFLLDDDRKCNVKKGEREWAGEGKMPKLHEEFWKEYGEGKNNKKDIGIIHSINTRISWIQFNIEEFLGIPPKDWKNKEYNLISRANDIFDNLKEKPGKLEALKNVFSFLKVKKTQ